MIKDKWEQLSARDQRTLKIGAIVLGVLFFLRVIWWPLYSRVGSIQDQIDQQIKLNQWMAPRVAQLEAAKSSGHVAGTDKSFSALEKSLQDKGLKPFVKQFSQNAQTQVSINFADVPFESVMHWLETAQRQGWLLQQMTVNKSDKPGVVQLQMVLG